MSNFVQVAVMFFWFGGTDEEGAEVKRRGTGEDKAVLFDIARILVSYNVQLVLVFSVSARDKDSEISMEDQKGLEIKKQLEKENGNWFS